MHVLKNLSIRTKLFLVSMIPTLGLVYLLYNATSESLAKKNAAQQVYQDCEEVERLSSLLHELQQERGWYLIYLANKNQLHSEEIAKQALMSNKALLAVQDIYRIHGKDSTELLLTLDSMDIFRESPAFFTSRINAVKSSILKEIFNISRVSKNPQIKNQLEAHQALLTMKEYFARTKNMLLPYLVDREFNSREFAALVMRKGQYELSRKKFELGASPDLLTVYTRLFSSHAVRDVERTLDSIIADPDYVHSMDQEDWWGKSMNVLNSLEEIERYSLFKIRKTAEEQVASMNRAVIINVGAGIVTLVLLVLLVSMIIRQIVASLADMKDAAQKLAMGEVDFSINVHAKDEVGDLANSFRTMVETIKVYAHTAEKIGKGNYDVSLVSRSANDVLGVALNNMKNDLARLSRENEIRTWLLTGNNRLNDCMRGEKSLSILADEVIRQLTEVLGGQVGAMYIRENGHLRRTGAYALAPGTDDGLVAMGEGLVGQVAASGTEIIFKDVPDNYLKIHSALGAAVPTNILVYPFTYEGDVKGVVEIGSTKAFSELDLQLMELVDKHIGIAVNASQSRDRLKQLLEETQRQSEELETQQEELKQYNEELLEKTQLLQQSEEALMSRQKALQRSNEELAEKAALLEEQKENLEFTKRQFEKKAKQLEMANSYKSEFLSNMSHELRTPLNSILILAQVLMENRNNTLSPKELKFASTIYHSGNDLLELISQILDLSKIEAGKIELDVSSFGVAALIQNLHNTFDQVAGSRKIKFDVHLPKKLEDLVMVSDQQRIEQILKNFLANAFKFTPQGGSVTLHVAVPGDDQPFATKALHDHQNRIAFTVDDNGIGIPEDKLEIIFEAFQQVDGSTKRQYGGTGLGLSISRDLARLLDGEIHVKSKPGVGSSFTVYLPIARTAQTTESQARQTIRIHPVRVHERTSAGDNIPLPISDAAHYDDQHLLSSNDRVILIMEDDIAFAKVLLDFVRERKYKGIVAHQGNIGLSYARHYKPDAIILDLGLPVVPGEDVLKKLKSDPELRHIPVQVISGHNFRKSALELGAIDFLPKPISRESFQKALDKAEHLMSRKPKQLLIVEDDVHHSRAVKELIGNGDVKCHAAFSGKEAMEMLSTNNFDCIIIDLGLPDMTGFKFLENIRAHQEARRVPVIVYTGRDLSKEEDTQLKKLANTVVLKTAFSHERLLDETTLFLHRVEAKLPKEKQHIIRKLHKTSEILRNKRVLVVDDDERNVYSLSNVLEQEGVECLTAGSAKEALALLADRKDVNLILMDVMMPEMDGFEATQAIRAIPDYQKIPVIALTAKAMKDDRAKCLAAGMSDYVAKPLNIQKLLSLMRVWLYE